MRKVAIATAPTQKRQKIECKAASSVYDLYIF